MSYVDGSKSTGGRYYSQSKGVKDQIRRRDNYTCQLCGMPGSDVDHIISWSESHDSTLANLRVLCHSCNCKLRRVECKTIPFGEYENYLKSELARC